ncbi:MAG: phosphopantetheine-binding protein [Acutalibacteraceae bacterium]
MDSLDVAEMIGEIEDQIGYEVELSDHIETLGELAKTIENAKEA